MIRRQAKIDTGQALYTGSLHPSTTILVPRSQSLERAAPALLTISMASMRLTATAGRCARSLLITIS